MGVFIDLLSFISLFLIMVFVFTLFAYILGVEIL